MIAPRVINTAPNGIEISISTITFKRLNKISFIIVSHYPYRHIRKIKT